MSKDIAITPVTSSQVAGLGYDPESKTLAVQFHPRANKGEETAPVYHYTGVEPDTFEAFQNSPSKGSFLAERIKGNYGYERIEPKKQEEIADSAGS